MEGGGLSRRLADGKTFDLPVVASWLQDLSDALDYIHGQGIVHGGIKPSAIVFDADDRPHVTDFALATVAGENDQRADACRRAGTTGRYRSNRKPLRSQYRSGDPLRCAPMQTTVTGSFRVVP